MEENNSEKSVMGTCLADILLQKNISYKDTAFYQSKIKEAEQANHILEKENESLLEQIDELKAIIRQINEEKKGFADSLFKKAVQELKAENYLDAVGFLQAVLLYNPENIKAMINLAVVYSEFGYQERAVIMLEAVLQKEPDNETAKKNLNILNCMNL